MRRTVISGTTTHTARKNNLGRITTDFRFFVSQSTLALSRSSLAPSGEDERGHASSNLPSTLQTLKRNGQTSRIDPHHNVGLTESDLVTKQVICIKDTIPELDLFCRISW